MNFTGVFYLCCSINSYNQRPDCIYISIKEKLQFWNWRNLTILGRIQIVKTFVIPIFIYRAGLVSVKKDVIKEANKIIFQFIWKGKDKVKRSTLIGDVENGGLNAPHLESWVVKTQRIMCCKKLAEAQLTKQLEINLFALLETSWWKVTLGLWFWC